MSGLTPSKLNPVALPACRAGAAPKDRRRVSTRAGSLLRLVPRRPSRQRHTVASLHGRWAAPSRQQRTSSSARSPTSCAMPSTVGLLANAKACRRAGGSDGERWRSRPRGAFQHASARLPASASGVGQAGAAQAAGRRHTAREHMQADACCAGDRLLAPGLQGQRALAALQAPVSLNWRDSSRLYSPWLNHLMLSFCTSKAGRAGNWRGEGRRAGGGGARARQRAAGGTRGAAGAPFRERWIARLQFLLPLHTSIIHSPIRATTSSGASAGCSAPWAPSAARNTRNTIAAQ